MKTKLSFWVVCLAVTGYAASPLGLEVTGVPGELAPPIARRLHAALLYDAPNPVFTGPAVRDWFWQADTYERQIRVVFTRYYAGEEQKIILPLVAARYSFTLRAEGTTAVYGSEGDSLLFHAPFSFRFERPVAYQVVGVHSDLPSAQISARSHHLLESEALDSLTGHIVRLLENGAPRHDTR